MTPAVPCQILLFALAGALSSHASGRRYDPVKLLALCTVLGRTLLEILGRDATIHDLVPLASN